MLVGLQNGEAALENSISQTLKWNYRMVLATPLLDIYPKELKFRFLKHISTLCSVQRSSQVRHVCGNKQKVHQMNRYLKCYIHPVV